MIIRIGLLILSIGLVLLSLSSVTITHHYVNNVSFSREYIIDVQPLVINPQLSLSYNGSATIEIVHDGKTINVTTPTVISLSYGQYKLKVVNETSYFKFINVTLPKTQCENSTIKSIPLNLTYNVSGKFTFSGVKTVLYTYQWKIGGIFMIVIGAVLEFISFLKRSRQN
jgi:hypothetical protein